MTLFTKMGEGWTIRRAGRALIGYPRGQDKLSPVLINDSVLNAIALQILWQIVGHVVGNPGNNIVAVVVG